MLKLMSCLSAQSFMLLHLVSVDPPIKLGKKATHILTQSGKYISSQEIFKEKQFKQNMILKFKFFSVFLFDKMIRVAKSHSVLQF